MFHFLTNLLKTISQRQTYNKNLENINELLNLIIDELLETENDVQTIITS